MGEEGIEFDLYEDVFLPVNLGLVDGDDVEVELERDTGLIE